MSGLTRIIGSLMLAGIAMATGGCSTFNRRATQAQLVTVTPYAVIEIRHDETRVYRPAYFARNLSLREVIRYIGRMRDMFPQMNAIAIRPVDKTIDAHRKLSEPLISYALKHGVSVTYLDPGGNSIDALLLSAPAHFKVKPYYDLR